MEERKAEIKIRTPITDEHWRRILFAVQAVCEIQILDNYVEVKSWPIQCGKLPACNITCEGCDYYKEIRKVK